MAALRGENVRGFDVEVNDATGMGCQPFADRWAERPK